MPGLTDRAGGAAADAGETIERAQQAWQDSMLRQVDELRVVVAASSPGNLAYRCGGTFRENQIRLKYWGQEVSLAWPELQACYWPQSKPCSVFDLAMLLYYLRAADGSPMADRWIGYRELPGGAFYSQAFQGYSGDRLARALGDQPEMFAAAAKALDGILLDGLPGIAYAFLPLPCIRLAAILYPGDDEFAARASVLFDAAAGHYMTTDGLALLGAGLVGRLLKAAQSLPSPGEPPH
jgi:hypothetical protein